MKNDHAHSIIKELRFLPVGAFLLMFSHVALLHLGYDLPVAEIGVIAFGFHIVYRFSKAFSFCLFHRLLIYYSFIVMNCIWLRRWTEGDNGIFGEHIFLARQIMFYLGLILLVLLCKRQIVKTKRKEEH